MDLLRFMTAGNVDDGKSTLVGRLFYEYGKIPKDLWAAIERSSELRGSETPNLAFLTDGLSEERAKGITIDAAFRYFATDKRKFILADSPGHLEYLPNMVTAATQAEAAVILVDSLRGVSTQTKRHAWITQWLGIRDIFFAINKVDAIGFDEKRYRAIESEVSAWMSEAGFSSRMIIAPLSALRGDNLIKRSPHTPWYAGPTLDEWLHFTKPKERTSGRTEIRFPIQIKRRLENGVEEFLGTLTSGVLTAGTNIQSSRLGRIFRVERIFNFDQELQVAVPEIPLRLVLSGDTADLGRGDRLSSAESKLPGSRRWEVEFCTFSENDLLTDRFLSVTDIEELEVEEIEVSESFDPDTQCWKAVDLPKIPRATIGRGVLRLNRMLYSDSFGEIPGAGRMVLIRKSDHATAMVILLKRPV